EHIRDKEKIVDILSPSTTPTQAGWTDSDSASVQFFKRLCRVFVRQHWIKLSDEDTWARSFVHDEYFEPVLDILRNRGRLVEHDNLGTGGKPAPAIHIKGAMNFLDPARSQALEKEIL